MNVSQAVRELGVSRQLFHRILPGKAPVTPEMAVRLGKWAGNGPALWLGMQKAFEPASEHNSHISVLFRFVQAGGLDGLPGVD
jgi:addiction module HigA family antidote